MNLRPEASLTLVYLLAAALTLPVPAAMATGVEEIGSPAEIVVALSQEDADEIEDRLRGLGVRSIENLREGLLVARVDRGREKRLAAAMSALPDVIAAAPSGRITALGTPPDDPTWQDPSLQPLTLGDTSVSPHAVNLEPAWLRAFLGGERSLNPYRPGVKVAIIDSGASMNWREDTGRIRSVWDYVDDDARAADEFGHGTSVASIVTAKSDNRFGIAGALNEATVTVEIYRILDRRGSGSTADALQAIMDAADRGCKVINCSFGEPVYEPILDSSGQQIGVRETPGLRGLYENAVAYARSKGSLVVAAAGNSATGDTTDPFRAYNEAVMLPAAADGAIAVGGIDPTTGLKSAFSSWGPELDLVAPAQKVFAVTTAGKTISGNGTSFATPIVSGSTALLWSLMPAAGPEVIERAILDSAVDYPVQSPDGFDPLYGHGRLDALAAYDELVDAFPTSIDVTLTASIPSGFWTTLSWTRATGKGVFYRFGVSGGSASTTTGTSGRVFLSSDGTHTVFVQEYASDRWADSSPSTSTVVVRTGLPPLASRRHSGPDRYATAAAVSRSAFPDTARAVVVASGQDWPDALSGSVLAHAAAGPLLLTPKASLAIQTRDEIVRLDPTTVYVVGGPEAVSSDVESRLRELVGASGVKRIFGRDRYATAEAVAYEVTALAGPPGTAVIASGLKFPDALAAAPFAARAGFPILLAKQDSLPRPTARALKTMGITRTLVAGGGPAVSSAVARQLPSVTRVGGRDRYETARMLADHAVDEGLLTREHVAVATGLKFPDALSAGPMMATLHGPILLADGHAAQERDWLVRRRLELRSLIVLGGPPAVSERLETSMLTEVRTP